MIVRAHQVVEAGFMVIGDDKGKVFQMPALADGHNASRGAHGKIPYRVT